MSLCSALDPLEDFLLAATTGSPGHGLNLSTNNGLDLSCQNYEGLNLSQHANSLQQENTSNPTSADAVVLNLTHQSIPQQHPGNGHVISSPNTNSSLQQHGNKGFTPRDQQLASQSFVQNNAEVGLNLSLQNGINLSRQAVQPGNRSNIELGYYYNDFNSITGDGGTQPMQNQGTTNFTFNARLGVDNSAYSIEQQRNSPLNLEHRSSPLNLTSVVHQQHQHPTVRNFHHPKHSLHTSNVVQQSSCHNIPQQQSQQQQNQNYFPSTNDQFNWSNLFYSQPEGTHQNDLDIYQSNDTVVQQDQGQQQQMFDLSGHPNPMPQTATGYNNHNDNYAGIIGTNTAETCNNAIQNASMGSHLVGGSSKIRLICSSCNQEFASTGELNEHMERHNSEIDAALLQHTSMGSTATAVPSMTSSSFGNRQRSMTQSSISHTCITCGMQFRDHTSLMHHQKTHSENNTNVNRMQQGMNDSQQQQQQQSTCQWNQCNLSQNNVMNTMVVTISNTQTASNTMSNIGFPITSANTYGYQESYQQQSPCQTFAASKKPSTTTMNSSLSLVSNSFPPKNDVNSSSISLDSIIPSIINDQEEHDVVMSEQVVSQGQSLDTFTLSPSKAASNISNITNPTIKASMIPNMNLHKQAPSKETTKTSASFLTSTPVPSILPSTSVVEIHSQNTEISRNNAVVENRMTEPPSSCPECSMVFTTGIDLRKHIDLIHQGRQGGKKYQCAICTVEFDEKLELKEHLEKHALEKPFKCDICGVRFANQAGQKRHKLRIHDTKLKTHNCDKCSKKFFDKHDLKRHLKIHKKDCNKCGKKLGAAGTPHNCSEAEKKRNKEESENDPELKCTICGVFTSNKISWGYHMWKHTKDSKYINLPVDTDTIETSSAKSKDVANNKQIQEDKKNSIEAAYEPNEVSVDYAAEQNVSRGVVVEELETNSRLFYENNSHMTEKSKNDMPNNCTIDKIQPNPPDAHATSYSQSSQPLCLQTSIRKPLLPEREIKPLNMQITNS